MSEHGNISEAYVASADLARHAADEVQSAVPSVWSVTACGQIVDIRDSTRALSWAALWHGPAGWHVLLHMWGGETGPGYEAFVTGRALAETWASPVDAARVAIAHLADDV